MRTDRKRKLRKRTSGRSNAPDVAEALVEGT